MAKCIECAWFPWKLGADFSSLPVMRCNPEIKSRRWTESGAKAEHECLGFKPGEEVGEEVNLTVEAPNGTPPENKPAIMPVAELKKYITETSDAQVIETLLETEKAKAEPRKTAIEALEARLEELKGAEADDPNTRTPNTSTEAT